MQRLIVLVVVIIGLSATLMISAGEGEKGECEQKNHVSVNPLSKEETAITEYPQRDKPKPLDDEPPSD